MRILKNTFGKVSYYKNHKTGAPLIVPDDDISGTFAFFRALEDSGYKENISAEEIGDAWLNYIVENETILWWGRFVQKYRTYCIFEIKKWN